MKIANNIIKDHLAQFTIVDLMNIPSNKKVIVDGCIPINKVQ